MAKILAITLSVLHLTTKLGKPGDKNAGIPATKPEIIEVPNNRRVYFENEDLFDSLLSQGAVRQPLHKEDVSVFPVFSFDDAKVITRGSSTGRDKVVQSAFNPDGDTETDEEIAAREQAEAQQRQAEREEAEKQRKADEDAAIRQRQAKEQEERDAAEKKRLADEAEAKKKAEEEEARKAAAAKAKTAKGKAAAKGSTEGAGSSDNGSGSANGENEEDVV